MNSKKKKVLAMKKRSCLCTNFACSIFDTMASWTLLKSRLFASILWMQSRSKLFLPKKDYYMKEVSGNSIFLTVLAGAALKSVSTEIDYKKFMISLVENERVLEVFPELVDALADSIADEGKASWIRSIGHTASTVYANTDLSEVSEQNGVGNKIMSIIAQNINPGNSMNGLMSNKIDQAVPSSTSNPQANGRDSFSMSGESKDEYTPSIDVNKYLYSKDNDDNS
eukprot:GHVT01036034.1.p1 GENE.GHVT01036034.1~~GHVT01036034.1.p1  ORF type:complete len:225 (-),score=2.88 GHVT01036034.1:188-862(-)